MNINTVCDRLTEIGKRAEVLPKLKKSQNEALERKYKPELDKVARGIQKAASAAGVNSGGEPEFTKSVARLYGVATAMQKLMK